MTLCLLSAPPSDHLKPADELFGSLLDIGMLRTMPISLLRQDTFLGCQSKLGWVPCLHHVMAR